MAVQITRRRMRSGGADSPAFAALALTGGFSGTVGVPVGLAVELGISADFVSALSAIFLVRLPLISRAYINITNKTFSYKLQGLLCQADLRAPLSHSRPR